MKLTKPQERVLRRILATNGGGIYAECDRDRPVIVRLHKKGLVQGKKGEPWSAVHTREGLDLIRGIDKDTERGTANE